MVYTMGNCGGKWVKVGHFSTESLDFCGKMGQTEHLFYIIYHNYLNANKFVDRNLFCDPTGK